jgi:hypothetical protein
MLSSADYNPNPKERAIPEQSVKVKITAIRRRLVKVNAASVSARCSICGQDVQTLTKTEAAAVLEIDQRELEHLVTEGSVHAISTISGNLRVCKDSLFTV